MRGNPMGRWTMALALALTALGTLAYLFSGMQSWTALIPAVFGGLFAVAGWASRTPGRRRVAFFAALALSFLGVAGTFGGLMQVPEWLRGTALERPIAVLTQATMALLCSAYLLGGTARQVLAVPRDWRRL